MAGTGPRILTVIFPSNYPNFAADSLWSFNRILFGHLVECFPEAEVLAVGPVEMPPLHPKIRDFTVGLGLTKFQVRFGFPWAELRALLEDFRPDVCFVNMPEQASNFAILIKDELALDCKIVNYIHYIPASLAETDDADIVYELSMNDRGNAPLMLLRILEGVMASDQTVICSDFGAKLLLRMAAKLLRRPEELPRIAVMPPPFDSEEIVERPHPTEAKPRFAYNHRLYDEYGTQELFELLSDVHAELGSCFEVLVTNPTTGRSSSRSRLNPKLDANVLLIGELPFVRLQHFGSRGDYYRALHGCVAGLAPLKRHALWSMSVVDVLGCGRPVVAFDIASFSEIGICEPYLVRDKHQFKQIIAELAAKPVASPDAARYRRIAEQFSGARTARRFMDIAMEQT